jgi:serine-type D-Ala-D-Ala carboxypeptidase/endopeptidase (penicillin-binding protein 4)
VFLVLALSAWAAGPASATDAKELRVRLARGVSAAGPASGTHVVDVGRKRVLFSVRADRPRVVMSNAKLFTTAAALEGFGPGKRSATRAMGRSAIGPGGVLEGDLHVLGGGDATFGDAAAVAAAFGGEGTTVESLVGAL